MDRHLADLAHALFECGAFKDYRASEGSLGYRLDIHKEKPETPLSPFYISLRTPDHPVPEKRGPVTPNIVEAIGQELRRCAQVLNLKYNVIAGIPEAGNPLAKAFHSAQPNVPRKPLIQLHKERPLTKEEEERAKREERKMPRFRLVVEGDLNLKDRVLLVDDLVSYGGTKSEAAGMLRTKFRAVVEDCLVVIDRRPHRLRKQSIAGLNLHAVFMIEDLVTCYSHQDLIPQEVVTRIMNYLETA